MLLKTDADGTIVEIRIEGRELFTPELIRAQSSTLRDVLDRYGKPVAVTIQGNPLVLKYRRISFCFDELRVVAGATVKAIILTK